MATHPTILAPYGNWLHHTCPLWQVSLDEFERWSARNSVEGLVDDYIESWEEEASRED